MPFWQLIHLGHCNLFLLSLYCHLLLHCWFHTCDTPYILHMRKNVCIFKLKFFIWEETQYFLSEPELFHLTKWSLVLDHTTISHYCKWPHFTFFMAEHNINCILTTILYVCWWAPKVSSIYLSYCEECSNKESLAKVSCDFDSFGHTVSATPISSANFIFSSFEEPPSWFP